MRVLIVASLFAPWRLGGAEVVAESSARALADLGHDVHVLTLSPDDTISKEQRDGYQVRRVPLFNIYPLQEMNDATTLQRVRWHIKDHWNTPMQMAFSKELAMTQPDVALLHNITGFSISIYKALSNALIPFVQVLHDHYFNCLYSTMYRNKKSCANKCLRCEVFRKRHAKTTQLANGVIGVSDFILNHTRALGCFSGVPAQVIKNLATASSDINSSDNIHTYNQESGCILGYLGALSEPKGVLDLVNAFEISAGPFDRLRLAGYLKNVPEQLLDTIKKDSRIEYLGIVDRDSFFSSIDCLVVPSKCREAFGLVAQEACFRGVPVLVSNQGALQEAIAGMASTYVYDASDPEGLTTALTNIFSAGFQWKPRMAIAHSTYKDMEEKWKTAYEKALLLALN